MQCRLHKDSSNRKKTAKQTKKNQMSDRTKGFLNNCQIFFSSYNKNSCSCFPALSFFLPPSKSCITKDLKADSLVFLVLHVNNWSALRQGWQITSSKSVLSPLSMEQIWPAVSPVSCCCPRASGSCHIYWGQVTDSRCELPVSPPSTWT